MHGKETWIHYMRLYNQHPLPYIVNAMTMAEKCSPKTSVNQVLEAKIPL